MRAGRRTVHCYKVWMPRRVAEFLGGGTNHAFPNYTSVSKSPQSINQYAFLPYDIPSVPSPLFPTMNASALPLYSRHATRCLVALSFSLLSLFYAREQLTERQECERNARLANAEPTTRTTRGTVAFSFSWPLSLRTLCTTYGKHVHTKYGPGYSEVVKSVDNRPVK